MTGNGSEPAYPNIQEGMSIQGGMGLTKRERFAMAAMQVVGVEWQLERLIRAIGHGELYSLLSDADLAIRAEERANALLAELEKRDET